MILRAADLARALRAPPDPFAGALVHGAAPDKVDDARRRVVATVGGEAAEAEMRLTRMAAADLRGDPAGPLDALKAAGFFPGPRVVVVEGVTEPQAAPVLRALEGWRPGDAALVVTAPALKKTSKLRAGFEGHRHAWGLALYDDPPGRDEVAAMAAEAGLTLTDEGRADLEALALTMELGEFRQLVETVALHAGDEAAGPAHVAAMAPAATEADIDAVIHAAAEGRPAAIGPLVRRLPGQGSVPVSLTIQTVRHFQQLHGVALGTTQPYGRARDAVARQARAWGPRRLGLALAELMDADLRLRSAAQGPQMAVIERALIRLAHLARARD